jgi:hypothetical protein
VHGDPLVLLLLGCAFAAVGLHLLFYSRRRRLSRPPRMVRSLPRIRSGPSSCEGRGLPTWSLPSPVRSRRRSWATLPFSRGVSPTVSLDPQPRAALLHEVARPSKVFS